MPTPIPGPLAATTPDGVTFSSSGDRLVLTATEARTGLATGIFAQPSVYATIPLEALGSGPIELCGFAFTQFAMPVRGSDTTPFDWNPAPNLHSPPAVVPLLARREDGTVLLAAPVDGWHEQIIAVIQDADGVTELRWGWHGDLDEVPAGFRTTLGLYHGTSAADVVGRWGEEIRAAAGSRPLDRFTDPVVTHLSYWTDNGAAYWYRTEPGMDLPSTLEAKLAELDDLGVGIGAVELDSWFYPHEISRPVTEIGYLESVPPTGMLEWTPRPDVLPDGVAALRRRLGDRPLVLHSRHISPSSPYVDPETWWIDLCAHPADQGFFRRWFDDARAWGATCIEQDWMMLTWFGVRQIRSAPGRALAWQRALDEAAAATDLHLLWCMPTPGDLMATVELDRVVAVRTSDDYRYADDPATLWHWYLTVNRLIDALGLVAFKDCFFTTTVASDRRAGDGIDGDPHPEVEALLSALSGGAAGIGDRLGRTDPDLLARIARPDGRLVKPDRPLAIADQSLFRPAASPDGLCWATTGSGAHRYVVALHTATTGETIADRFDLGSEMLVYDWRRGTAAPATTVPVTLGHRDWALFVCCPMTTGDDGTRRATIGDPTLYATMGSCVGGEAEQPPRRLQWDEATGLTDTGP